MALEHKKYEKLKKLLEKNCEMISEHRDCFEGLLVASLINDDFKSFEIVFDSLEKYINEDLNKENKTIQLLKSAKYYPFIKGNKHEAFCKLWLGYKEYYREDIREWGNKDIGIIAIRNNDIELLTALKNISYDFSRINDEVKTVETAKIFVAAGLDIQAPFLSAIINENTEVALFLLDKGADINEFREDFSFCFSLIKELFSSERQFRWSILRLLTIEMRYLWEMNFSDRPIHYIKDCETLQLFLPKINFLGLFKAFVVCNSPQFRRLIFREVVYRMRYILLAAVIIPAIYIAAVSLNAGFSSP